MLTKWRFSRHRQRRADHLLDIVGGGERCYDAPALIRRLVLIATHPAECDHETDLDCLCQTHIVMPMTAESVAIYLGIIKAGCVVAGIADSFRPKGIASRLRIAKAEGVLTQDIIVRGGKILELYNNIIDSGAPPAIVPPAGNNAGSLLRAEDRWWSDFLKTRERFEAVVKEPPDAVNILFSSGTTAEPKAIPWTQTTPLKCAMDAHFHQDIHPGDVLVWPTHIGWMMGPWLIFASLLNRAALGLYNGAPTGRDFGLFVRNSRATMLGVVPSLVKAWRRTGCMEGLDWSTVKLFSSTGECSNRDDMHWLMAKGGWKPVIEYCGGTEIGGAYITGTVALPCVPGTFNTPALGLDFVILDEAGSPAENGELFIVPPSIGLSTALIIEMQDAITRDLNPLFKIHDLVLVGALPRTASNKIMRRALRDQYSSTVNA